MSDNAAAAPNGDPATTAPVGRERPATPRLCWGAAQAVVALVAGIGWLVVGFGAARAVIEVLLVANLLAGMGLLASARPGSGVARRRMATVLSVLAGILLLVVVLGIVLLLAAAGI